MGFFSKKKKNIDLDLPPPPPPSSKLFPVPPAEKEEKEEIVSGPPSSELPPIPVPEEGKDSSLPLDLKDLEKDIPAVPDLDELESELPPLREEGQDELLGLKEHEEVGKISAGPIEHEEFPNIQEEVSEPTQEKGRIKMFPTPKFEDLEEPGEEPEKPRLKEGPVFVNVNSYKDALSSVVLIRSRIKESEDCLKRLNEIKNSKDKYFEQFRVKLEDLQRKSLYVDKSLFEGGMSK